MTRVLIVEDSPTQARELELILKSEGFDIEIARDGRQALERFGASKFDIVLSDVVMPGLSGYELCRKIKEDDTRDVPVVLLTSLNDPTYIVQGLECGADNFVTKPYEPGYLIGRIRSILANRAIRAGSKFTVGVEMLLLGKKVSLTSDRHQILDLLISTFEELLRTKQREDESRRTQDVLRESQRFLQSTLDALSAHIAVLDSSGTIIAVNTARNRFGSLNPLFEAFAGVGGNYLEICESGSTDHTEAAPAVAAGIRQVIAHERGDFYLEFPYRTPAEDRWFTVKVTRVENAPPARVVVAHEEITERKRAEEALRYSQEQLRHAQKMEAVGRLAGGVAHDFNNLLTVITGYSKLLLDSLRDGDQVRADIEEIYKAGTQGASLTRQLLAFSRKQVLQPTVIDLNIVVGNIEKMLRRLIGADIQLITDCSSAPSRVKVDTGQIEQVMVNLAVNARDAMPRGGKLIIETAAADLDETYSRGHMAVTPGPYVLLNVSDTGCGMDAETQSHIFEPFFTTKETGKGTGLGLATVYGIVKQSGGYIWVYSELGQGTTFKIYLPRIEEPAQSLEPDTCRTMPPQGCETILLVEDQDGIRALARRILQKAGYKVLEAESGSAALQIFERYTGVIDLVLTDVIMPQMSGKELADRLKEMRSETKVLYMSGYTDKVIFEQGMLDGRVPFIAKPFRDDVLLETVRATLDRSARPDAALVAETVA